MNSIDVENKIWENIQYRINRIKDLKEDIIWQSNTTIKQKMIDEIKKEKYQLIEMSISEFKSLEKETEKVKQVQKQKIFEENNLKPGVTKEAYINAVEAKLDEVLIKREKKLLKLLEPTGITVEDIVQHDSMPVLSNNIKRPKVECNIETGIYKLTTIDNEVITKKISPELLSNKTKKDFTNQLLKNYAIKAISQRIKNETIRKKELENFIYGKENIEVKKELVEKYILYYRKEFIEIMRKDIEAHRGQFELIAEFADINLYNFYHEYNPQYAQDYLIALDLEDGSFMPTKLEYDREKSEDVFNNKKIKRAQEGIENQDFEGIYEFELPKLKNELSEDYIEPIKADEYINLDEDIENYKKMISTNAKKENPTKDETKYIKRQDIYSYKKKGKLLKKAKEHVKLGLASMKSRDRGFIKKCWMAITNKLGLAKEILALGSGIKRENNDYDENLIYKIDIKIEDDRFNNRFKNSIKKDVPKLDIDAITKSNQDIDKPTSKHIGE